MIDATSTEQPSLIERAAWSLAWLAILTTGVDVWGQWTAWPGMAIVSPLVVLTGLVGAVVLWSVGDPASKALQRFAFAAATGTVLATQGPAIGARSFYSTDSAAFNHVATQLLLRGHDPYTSSMASAAQFLPTPADYWTYTANGAHVTQVSYPAGSFLLQAPLMALGLHHLPTDWLDLAAWLVTGALLFAILPRSIRWLAPVLLLADAYVGPFANGGTDALFIPFLVVAVWQWDRFATATRPSMARWLSPVALGVACSIKQSPWFCVPFLLLGVALEARAARTGVLRTTMRYASMTAGAFLVINSAFIVWDPGAWWHGTMLPLLTPLVPDGQGLVTLALHGLSGGADLRLLSLAGGLVMLSLFAAMLLKYPSLKRTWLFALPIVLFVPGRSLTSYLLDFFPVAVVAAVSVRPGSPDAALTMPTWARRSLIATPMAGAVLLATLALRSAPLVVTVDSLTTADAHQAVAAVTVTVHNRSGRYVTPNFMYSLDGGHPSGFWHQSLVSGVLPLAPGGSATITIRPDAWTWAPQRGEYWLVEAYTSPDALSTSSPQRWPFGPR